MATTKNLNQYVIKVQKGGTKRRKPNKTEENLKTNALQKIRFRIVTERANVNRRGIPSLHEFPPEVSERIERTKKYRKRQRALKEAIRRRRTQERARRTQNRQAITNSNRLSNENQRNENRRKVYDENRRKVYDENRRKVYDENRRKVYDENQSNTERSYTNYDSHRSPNSQNSQATQLHAPNSPPKS
jgi:hypothetical protein